MESSKRVAVIDVGTLKSKFEIREFAKGQSTVLFKDKKLTVLGRDLDKTGNKIIRKSIDSTIDALICFKKKMSEFGVENFRAVTTEAIRRAINSDLVLSEIKKKTGIELEILTHEEEALTLFKSVSSDFPGQVIAVCDIGGGSVQIVIGRDEEIYEKHLFKTGTYYLQEEYSKSHHPTEEELLNAREYVHNELSPLKLTKYQPELLVYGTTNIIDFMKSMKLELLDLGSHSSMHPYYIQEKTLHPLYETIISLSYEDRMPMYPNEPYYMWGADKALMNIFEISDYLCVERIVPSNNNISTAILHELAK